MKQKKISYTILKEFDSQSVYNDKYIETKRKTYNDKFDTDFHDSGIPKDGSCFIGMDKSSYAHVFLEDCKYLVAIQKQKDILIAFMS